MPATGMRGIPELAFELGTRPFDEYQAVQRPLVDAFVALEGAWALTAASVERRTLGERAGPEANVAKTAACEAGRSAVERLC